MPKRQSPNAAKHANASVIEVRIPYGWREFHLALSDNGKGLDRVTQPNGREGHFGLIGMLEKARKMREALEIGGRDKGGTRVVIVVPALIAYGMLSWFPSALFCEV